MTSLPPPPPSPPSDTATASNTVDGIYGPVTKLAAIVAARDEKARIRRSAFEQERLKTTASLVGETALAIAAARASGNAVRLSPARRQTLPRKEFSSAAGGGGKGAACPLPRLSVAARARAAADLPAERRAVSAARAVSLRKVAASSSGNAGVSRGKFSKAQVKQVIDEWGKDDTSEDDDDYYYDGASDSSADVEGCEEYSYSLESGHRSSQYPAGQPPRRNGKMASPKGGIGETNDDEFRYQHHRATAYSNASTRSSHPQAPLAATPSPVGSAGTNTNSHPYDYPHDDDGAGGEDSSGGILTSAKNWLQSQRERLHQMDLERQVEDQRRKLVEEGRRQRAFEADGARWRIAGDDATVQPCEIAPSGSFGCIDRQGDNSEESLCNVPEQGVVGSNLCGFGGLYANQQDDSTDYSGVARVDSSGNILELIPSGSLESAEEDMKDCMKVSSPKFTLSGKGMSVKVDMPEQNDYQNAIDCNNDNVDEKEDDERMVSLESEVKVVPETPEDDDGPASPPILRPCHMRSFVASGGLPPSLSFFKWERLYSLGRDGDSFAQFLRLVEGRDRTVLVVKTMRGHVFGGYADTRWEARHYRRHACEFYGSAQACLFRFPDYGAEGEGGDEGRIDVYKWSGANRYIQLCDASRRTVAFGGGGDEGYFGLCIEDDFRRGTTGHCSTFENEALCEEGYFDIMDLEVWGFTLDYF